MYFQMTFGQFDSPGRRYGALSERLKDIREGIEEENSIEEGFPQPHVHGAGLYTARWRSSPWTNSFIEVLMERAPGTSANPTVAIARRALAILEAARSG